ncbi:MAG: DUF1684 domain-containing protein [Caldilineaceae bacterium]
MAIKETYQASMQKMRQERAAAIAADRSWLTLAGLYWLQPGDNAFGAATSNGLVLPNHAGTSPAVAGRFNFVNGVTTLHAAPGVVLCVNGNPATTQELQPDAAGAPDLVTLASLTMVVIKRGARTGIRLYDDASPRRQAFTELDWFAVDPTYRIEARFEPYEPAKPITYGNVLGDMVTEECPGAVVFGWQGTECRLDALPRGDKLFFNFRDATNGESTYGAGRFLYTDAPQDGVVVVDFNQATNPYCAYTPYGTCPLPPVQNRLPVRIEAGERNFSLPVTAL